MRVKNLLTSSCLLLFFMLEAGGALMESPCPRLFTYEPQKENDRWYGVVTLISDTDLKGVWLRLVFDKPSLQLGNWFGEIRTTDNMEYLIHNRNHELKANMPYALRFYIKYTPGEPVPKLVGFRLNARPVCPEGQATTPAAITGGHQLLTSAPNGGGGGGISSTTPATFVTQAPTPTVSSGGGSSETFARPGGGWPGGLGGFGGGGDDDDDIFQGDFQLIGRPSHLRPSIEAECGTVVARRERRERRASGTQHTPNFPEVNVVLWNEQGEQGVEIPPGVDGNIHEWILQFLNQHIRTSTPSLSPRVPDVYDGLPADNEDVPLERVPMNPDQEPKENFEQQPRPLITFGQTTREGEFPWHAALYRERGADLQYICGASLVSHQHVITVAHCVTRRRSATPLNPDSLVVYLGKYYLKKWGNTGIQDSQVSVIYAHPQYNSQTYANDIAILKLVNPVTYTDYVRPICLWADGAELDTVLTKPGTVVGWGFDHTGKVTEELTQAKMPVVTKETCIYSFPDFFSRFTTSKTYCAGFRNGTSVCNGDSGGGMVFPKSTSAGPGREVWQLRGLVSISVALQNQFKCDASHYVVFTDVAKYLTWINSVLKQE